MHIQEDDIAPDVLYEDVTKQYTVICTVYAKTVCVSYLSMTPNGRRSTRVCCMFVYSHKYSLHSNIIYTPMIVVVVVFRGTQLGRQWVVLIADRDRFAPARAENRFGQFSDLTNDSAVVHASQTSNAAKLSEIAAQFLR